VLPSEVETTLSSLSNRTVIVTGGSRGIGRAAVELLRHEGANVAVIARESASLREVAERTGAVAFPADVTDDGAVVDAVGAVDRCFGPIHGLFANAGIGILEGPVHLLPPSDWDRVIATNLRGSYVPAREVLSKMVDQGTHGSIVFTSSCVVQNAVPGVGSAYHAAKGALEAMARSIAVDYGRFHIRCNSISPGATETELMWTGVSADEQDSARKTVGERVALGRVADPAEIGRAAVWLLSDESSYVTGATLVVDGGVGATSVLPT
jgi:NAD(P)-dependent dehydrogenase (short-subunit alcohol dehydrogenase family)